MFPKELQDIFEEYTEDDYDLFVTAAYYLGNDFQIDFQLNVQNIADKGAITQNWTIKVTGYRKSNVSFEFANLIEITSDHPLLWEFTDIQCQLYYNGQCSDPARLFYNLYQTHKKTYGSFQCFNMPFWEETTYFKPFQFSNGLLAEGPKKLMELYGEALRRNGLDFTIIGERPAKYWDGQQFILEDQELKMLFIGDTFLIAKEFSFEKDNDKQKIDTTEI